MRTLRTAEISCRAGARKGLPGQRSGRRRQMSAQMYLAYDYPLLSAFWTMLVFFLWIMWFVLLFRIIVDIFRDDSLGGWAKAGWLLFVIVLPFLGVLVY